ncbi:hypothetical protein [Rhizobium sp. CSW-27]|uniref:hypothetical protein n=1 Tax=Rhizobium sp. CSW-27 TaxID=2839985 RepID=UPI001C02BD3B|nr:hypothetical protein [Rhizobium sp. CSW-27]MBT9370297.1 hypothetical protein [Rhizobium sp. CSW-27]
MSEDFRDSEIAALKGQIERAHARIDKMNSQAAVFQAVIACLVTASAQPAATIEKIKTIKLLRTPDDTQTARQWSATDDVLQITIDTILDLVTAAEGPSPQQH